MKYNRASKIVKAVDPELTSVTRWPVMPPPLPSVSNERKHRLNAMLTTLTKLEKNTNRLTELLRDNL